MLQSYLAWYQPISSYPASGIAVGWRLDGPHPTPSHRAHPLHREEGGLMGYDHDQGRGGGGATRNLEHIYI